VKLYATLDPERGERCPCGALAIVVWIIPAEDELLRIAWCGDDCAACVKRCATVTQRFGAFRRRRRWARERDLLGEPKA
jgi:hypothetical protein